MIASTVFTVALGVWLAVALAVIAYLAALLRHEARWWLANSSLPRELRERMERERGRE